MIAVDKNCSSVPVGEGRLLNCLEKNDKQVSERCEQALNGIEELGKPEIFSSSRLKTKSPAGLFTTMRQGALIAIVFFRY